MKSATAQWSTVIECCDRPDWLAERRLGIGGSDAPVICGESRWKSPFTLYQEKVGEVDGDDLKDVEAVRWGNLLEPAIRGEVEERLEQHVNYSGPFAIHRHHEVPYMRASIDGDFPDPSEKIWELFDKHDLAGPEGQGLLEIKTASAFKSREWKTRDEDDEPQWPLAYQIQTAHYMAVLNVNWGVVACLVGGQRLEMVPVVRNRKFEHALMVAEQRFWECVRDRVAPTPDGSWSTTETLKKLYGGAEDDGEEVYLEDEEWVALDAALQEEKKQRSELEKRIKERENQLKAAIKTATYCRLRDGSRYSLRLVERGGYEVAPTSFRQLRREKA